MNYKFMYKVVRRHFLKRGEIKKIISRFCSKINVDDESIFKPKPKGEVIETGSIRIFRFNDLILIEAGENLLPSLISERILNMLPRIIVDMGAVPHICNGADVMAPGVTGTIGNFRKDDLVLVIDEKHHKPLAICQALLSSEDLKKTKKGKVAVNIHHVSDRIWNLIKEIS